jgi:hypothetical protein
MHHHAQPRGLNLDSCVLKSKFHQVKLELSSPEVLLKCSFWILPRAAESVAGGRGCPKFDDLRLRYCSLLYSFLWILTLVRIDNKKSAEVNQVSWKGRDLSRGGARRHQNPSFTCSWKLYHLSLDSCWVDSLAPSESLH